MEPQLDRGQCADAPRRKNLHKILLTPQPAGVICRVAPNILWLFTGC
jgi:hypothetical protein